MTAVVLGGTEGSSALITPPHAVGPLGSCLKSGINCLCTGSHLVPLSVCLALLTYLVAFSISVFKIGIHDQNLIIFETSVPLQNV